MGSGIKFISQVLNQKGAPALYEDTIDNRPAATFEGRLFFATDVVSGDTIFRDNGDGTWSALAGNGGGGGSFTNGVTNLIGGVGLGGYLTQNTEIGLNGLSFKLTNNGDNLLLDTVNDLYYFGKGNALDTGIGLHIVGTRIYTQYTTFEKGLNLDFSNSIYSINNSNSTQGIFYDENNTTFIIGHNPAVTDGSGLKIDAKNYYRLGDYDVGSNGNYLFIDNVNNQIATYNGGNEMGLRLDFDSRRYYLGDFDAINNETYLNIDDLISTIYFYSGLGKYNFANVPTYPSNAAAITGGLNVGDIYQHNDHSIHIVQ